MNTFFKSGLLWLLAFMLFFTACTPQPAQAPPTETPVAAETPTPANPWWNQAVFYQIFVRSFQDSDGDGIGDFNGVTSRLDYLQALGVKGIWLLPIHPSPSYHGYDVTDYYAVHPDYGTMEDFKNLLAEAHKRDIRIIIDLVLNHSSSKHPWFQAALTPGNPYQQWYIWSDTDPGIPGPWGAQAWHRASNGKYYYGIFWDQMPDLNFDNPEVRQEAFDITAFWLNEVGVDGFRLDAIRYLIEDEKRLADTPGTHTFLAEWRTFYRAQNQNAFTVGEIWTDNYTVSSYTRTNTGLDSAFSFDLSTAILKAINESNNALLNFVLASIVQHFPEQDNANFITNHDMTRVINQIGGAHKMERAKTAAAILLTAPGIPFIYYGEEIGMTGAKPDQYIRTPMQWNAEAQAGFTTANPWIAVNAHYPEVNVAAQTGDANSLLEHYRALIHLRNQHSALKHGQTYMLKSSSSKLTAYLRISAEETVLILINLDDQPVSNFTLKLDKSPMQGSFTPETLFGTLTLTNLTTNEQGGFEYAPIAEIPAFGISIVKFK